MGVPNSRAHLVFVGSRTNPADVEMVVLIDHAQQRYDARQLGSSAGEGALKFLWGLDQLAKLGAKYRREPFGTDWLNSGIETAAATTDARIFGIETTELTTFPPDYDAAAWAEIYKTSDAAKLNWKMERAAAGGHDVIS